MFRWCRRPESNRHARGRLILNQLRLPIPPLRHRSVFWKTSLLYLRHSVVQQLSLRRFAEWLKRRRFSRIRDLCLAGEFCFISALNNNIFLFTAIVPRMNRHQYNCLYNPLRFPINVRWVWALPDGLRQVFLLVSSLVSCYVSSKNN